MNRAGFTLVEMMIALGIFVMMITGLVAVQIFGMRISTLASTKLIATTDARETMNAMRDQIRSAQQVYVGTFIPSNGTFTQIPLGTPQIGNALQLITTTNLASPYYTIFYMDPSTNEVFSVTNNPATSNLFDGLTLLAQYMTNYLCFDAEDYRSWMYPTNIMTNYVNNPVIGVTFNFSQWEYPIGYVGGNAVNAYDYYYLRTHISRRSKQ
jgi:prepilin-type N-terminal cleavage/methylation domain-containing protein